MNNSKPKGLFILINFINKKETNKMGNMSFIARGIQRFTGGSDADVTISADKQKNLLVAQGNPSYLETRRRGNGWTVKTVTPATVVVVVPTTLAHLEVYNNGTRLMVVSDLFMWRLLGTAVAQMTALWAVVTTQKAIPTNDALVLYSMSGKALWTPTATSEVVTSEDSTIIDNGWQPFGYPATGLGAATPGIGQSVAIDGKLTVPPGCSLCVTVTGNVNTASAVHCGATFDLVDASQES